MGFLPRPVFICERHDISLAAARFRVQECEQTVHGVAPSRAGAAVADFEPRMSRNRRVWPETRGSTGGLDRRVHDAITDLSAYALTLDVERDRLDSRLGELLQRDSSAAERRAVIRERDEIAEELHALRRAIDAFRDEFAPRPSTRRTHAPTAR